MSIPISERIVCAAKDLMPGTALTCSTALRKGALPRMAKKFERRNNLTSQGDRACRSAELGRRVAKRLPRLHRSPNRTAQIRKIRVAGLNLGRAITLPLDGNSAGAHPIARG